MRPRLDLARRARASSTRDDVVGERVHVQGDAGRGLSRGNAKGVVEVGERRGRARACAAAATPGEERETASGLRKVLTRMDLTMLGVGGIVGAGVFVLTGAVAHDHAGRAVVFSVSSAGGAVTGLAYAEFAVAMPVAGSAYNYMYATFGEYAAFLTGCNLALELTIASAAGDQRGWTSSRRRRSEFIRRTSERRYLRIS